MTDGANALVLLLVLLILLGILVWVAGLFIWRIQKRRITRQRAEALGWEYNGKHTWEYAAGGNFKTIYSYSAETKSVPWVFTYSVKTTRRATLRNRRNSVGFSGDRKDRTDWRSDAVTIPHTVFLRPRPSNKLLDQMTTLMGLPTDTYVNYLLSLGITEADAKMGFGVILNLGNVSTRAFSNPLGNLPDTKHGLREIEALSDDTFIVYAASEEAASEVLNSTARTALDTWRAAFEERFGKRARVLYARQPMILLHEGGVYMTFADEEPNILAIEAIVELGTQLVQAHKPV